MKKAMVYVAIMFMFIGLVSAIDYSKIIYYWTLDQTSNAIIGTATGKTMTGTLSYLNTGVNYSLSQTRIGADSGINTTLQSTLFRDFYAICLFMTPKQSNTNSMAVSKWEASTGSRVASIQNPNNVILFTTSPSGTAVAGNNVASPFAMNLNSEYWVCGVSNATSNILLVNGTLVNSTTRASTGLHNNTKSSWIIGCSQNVDACALTFNGTLDEVMFLNFTSQTDVDTFINTDALATYSAYLLDERPYDAIDYYVCPNGSDSNTGLDINNPIKTITKVNTLVLNPLDNVWFCRGQDKIWRGQLDDYLDVKDGSADGLINYGAYGTGDKPQFWGSINASSQANWTSDATNSSNIWNTTFSATREIGNIIFNISKGEYTGKREMVYSGLNTQGDFYYNATTDKVSLYSVGNPATFYSGQGIELAEKPSAEGIIDEYNLKYTTISNISLKYGGVHGLALTNTLNVSVYDMDVRYTGGVWSVERYGNCIQFGLNQTNTIIQRNNVSQCFDACYSPQAWTTGGTSNIITQDWSYNLGAYCDYEFEYFNSRTTDGITHNVSVHHNTFTYSGRGFSSGQRTNTIPEAHIRISRSPSGSKNLSIYDNIFYDGTDNIVAIGGTKSEFTGADYYSNYNLMYNGSATTLVFWFTDGAEYSNLNLYKAVNGNESNSIQLNDSTLFATGTLNPLSTSVACNMSSTGSFVGALPCVTASTPEENETEPETNTTSATTEYAKQICQNSQNGLNDFSSWLIIIATLVGAIVVLGVVKAIQGEDVEIPFGLLISLVLVIGVVAIILAISSSVLQSTGLC